MGALSTLLAATENPHVLSTVCVQQNYVWLLTEPSGKVGVVDPSEARPVINALQQRWACTGQHPPAHEDASSSSQQLACLNHAPQAARPA